MIVPVRSNLQSLDHNAGARRHKKVLSFRQTDEPMGVWEAAVSRAGTNQNAHQLAEDLGQVVGLGRLELPTSPLSGVRSSHLSYRPFKNAELLLSNPFSLHTLNRNFN